MAATSLLSDLYPFVWLTVPEDAQGDFERLFQCLLPKPLGSGRALRNRHWRAAALDNGGQLRGVNPPWSSRWRDKKDMEARLDQLIATDTVRAVAHVGIGLARLSDGHAESQVWSTRLHIGHRTGLSYDFYIPMSWSRVRDPFDPEPVWVDRIEREWPYRVWPGQDEDAGDVVWRSLPSADLFERYRAEGDYDDFMGAIEAAELALRLQTKGRPGWASAADELAGLLAAYFRHAGDLYNLNRAIFLCRRAVKISPGDARIRLNLAAHLGLHFAATADLSSLEAATEMAREAVESAAEASDGAAAAETLIDLLLLRHRATAEQRWLGEAVGLLNEFSARYADHPEAWTPARMRQLAALNSVAFEQTGSQGSAERAVQYTGTALDAIAESDPLFPLSLRDHGVALLRAYEAFGDERKLLHACTCFVKANERMHQRSPERADVLLNLAATYLHPLPLDDLNKGLLEGDARDLGASHPSVSGGLAARAVMAIEEALTALAEATPDHPRAYASFAAARLQRFRRDGTGPLEQALQAYAEGSPERSRAYALLATAYLQRFRVGGLEKDLQAALAAAEDGLRVWNDLVMVTPMVQKVGQSHLGGDLHAIAVEAHLAQAVSGVRAAPDSLRRAFVLAEAAKSRLLTEQLSRSDLPVPHAVPKRLARGERSLLGQLAALDTAGLAAHDTGIDGSGYLSNRIGVLFALDLLWTKIASYGAEAQEHVAIRRAEQLSWPQITDTVTRLGPRAAVVSLLVLKTRTVVFTVRAGAEQPTAVEVEISQHAWSEAMRRFGRELPRSRGSDDVPETWRAALQPILDAIRKSVAGCDRVVVVPHAAAHALPWTLLAQDWTGPEGGPPVVAATPALAVLDRLHRRPRAQGSSAMVVGNPTCDLPHAEAEAHTVARLFGVRPLIGLAATRTAVAATVSSVRMLHLAGHARFHPGSPLDSHVLLADGPWHARDALAARLSADLVVLSGCETGISQALSGEESAGIAQAFLHAGARCLIVSLWRVDDASTAVFMRCFHEHRGAGWDVAQALAKASDDMRRRGYHASHWAAFQAVGDTRR
ncbi:CHAT domain-containing protein [Streptomyces sp. NPDC002680]|uniref:CHAT domain-containing protein n=1 Tax=Streptomyces sp. NPDC002680 TaxID=3364659 RepID=UPI0036869598